MRVENNGIFRVKTLADLLDVHRSTIYRAIDSGALNALKIGSGKGALRIPGNSVNVWLSECADAAYNLVEDSTLVEDSPSVEALDDAEVAYNLVEDSPSVEALDDVAEVA